MQRARWLALGAILLLACACDFAAPAATPTPTAIPMPTATPQPTALPMPTLAPATGILDLGIAPADTYGVRGMALDEQRGLLYLLAERGDASNGQGVLTIVELASQRVRASAPVPLSLVELPGVVLSADGQRLYVAAPDRATLQVISTDPASLGGVLGNAPGVVAAALDRPSQRLYVVGERGLRGLNAMTLDGEQYAALPDPATGLTMRWLVVNEEARLLYVTHPGAERIAVYRLEDLSVAAAITPGGYLKSLICVPGRDTAYALMEYYTALGAATRVVALQGERQSGQWWDAEPGWVIGQIAWDNDRGHLLLLEDSSGSDAAQSRWRVVHPDGDQPRPTGTEYQTLERITTTYLDWVWSGTPAPLTYRGRLYKAGEALMEMDLRTGVGQRIELGLTLVSAALDEETDRLLVLDSTGAVRVVDLARLQAVASWPGTLETGLGGVSRAPLTAAAGRLYVTDYAARLTWVLDASSGARLGAIPKAGQVSVDARRKRLFVTQDGVYVVDGDTFQITGAIQETVTQDPLRAAPGALGTLYDPLHDLLLVTMSDNSLDSSASTWLQAYDGETLTRLERPYETGARSVASVALTRQPDRLWVAGVVPVADLRGFALDGRLLVRVRGLGGALFAADKSQQLYVADWEGLVTVDGVRGDVIAYSVDSLAGASFALFDAQNSRLYANPSRNANLMAIDPKLTATPEVEAVDALPVQAVQGLAVGDDGTVLAVSGNQWGPATAGAVIGIRRPDGGWWWQVAGALPARAWPVTKAAPGVPGVFFAYSADAVQAYGLFRSTDNGQTWHPAMRGLADMHIVDLAFSPHFAQDRTALLLAGDSGLFRTQDGGETWTRVHSLTGYRVRVALTAAGALRVLVLAADPENPGQATLYATTEPPAELERLGVPALTPGMAISSFAVSPDWSKDATALVGFPLQLSRDGGRSWQPVGPEPSGSRPSCQILFSPQFATDRTAYALVIEHLYGGRQERSLLRSRDGGETWEKAVELAPPLLSALAMGRDGQLWAGDTQGMVAPLDPAPLSWQPVAAPTPVSPTPESPEAVPTPAPTPPEWPEPRPTPEPPPLSPQPAPTRQE